jgi:hypothetical protein
MGLIKGVRATYRRLYARLFPVTVAMPSRILDSAAPSIRDGVDYAQPVLLPGHLRQQLEASGKLQEWYDDRTDVTVRGAVNTVPVSEDPLQELPFSVRIQVNSTCHSAVQRNPIAKRAVHYVSAFVVGDGFNLNCQNKQVEEKLQAFIDNPDNAIREYERQALIDLLVDGELFLRYFQEGDEVVAVPQRPWEVQYIHTQPGFFRRPLKYHMQPYSQYNTDDPASTAPNPAYDVPAKDMQHVAINRHSYELRGRPELYAALPWLRAHKEWQENRAKQNYWRGTVLWWVKIASQVPGVIAAKLAQYQRPPTPGSTVVTSDKEEWSALTNPVGAGDASEDGRQLKIMALNGIAGIPEYMTGDGQNANLATTTSQQLPVLKTFSEFQTIMIEQVWFPMFKRVLQAAIDAGTLPEEVEEQDSDGEPVPEETHEPMAMSSEPVEEAFPAATAKAPQFAVKLPTPEQKPLAPAKKIKTIDAFDVTYEPVGDSDPQTLAQAITLVEGSGYISVQTATTELGYDFAVEQKRIQRERQKNNDAIARGEIPPPQGMIPPGAVDTANPPQAQSAQAA